MQLLPDFHHESRPLTSRNVSPGPRDTPGAEEKVAALTARPGTAGSAVTLEEGFQPQLSHGDQKKGLNAPQRSLSTTFCFGARREATGHHTRRRWLELYHQELQPTR